MDHLWCPINLTHTSYRAIIQTQRCYAAGERRRVTHRHQPYYPELLLINHELLLERVNYVSKISSAFGTRYILSYVPGTSYPFMPVATYRSTVCWQSKHQLGHHYPNAIIPCVKEARWDRHEAQDSIVLSMSNC